MILISIEIEMLKEYTQGRISYINPTDKDILNKVVNNLHKIISFEKPDFVIPLDKKIMIIEHFQFDASKHIKGKGNLDKYLLSERNRDFNRLILGRDEKKTPLTITKEVNCKYKAEYYVANLERVFLKHIDKIDSYKKRIVEKFDYDRESILSAFLIIDTTPLGNYIMRNGKMIPFSIFQLKKFNCMMKKFKQVDYIFNGFYDGNKNITFFMSNTVKSRNIYKDDLIDFNKDEYFSFSPKETRYFINLDNKDYDENK